MSFDDLTKTELDAFHVLIQSAWSVAYARGFEAGRCVIDALEAEIDLYRERDGMPPRIAVNQQVAALPAVEGTRPPDPEPPR